MQELSLLKPLILEALARVGGRSVVRDVRFAVGVLPPLRSPRFPGRPRSPPTGSAPPAESRTCRLPWRAFRIRSFGRRLAKILVKHVETSPGSRD